MPCADRKCNDCASDQNEVHDHEYGLKSSHDPGSDCSKEAMQEDAADEDCIDFSVGRLPVAVPGEHNDGSKLECESIYSESIVFEEGHRDQWTHNQRSRYHPQDRVCCYSLRGS